MRSPRVSVVILTYRRPELVGRAIRSVLGQTYRDLEAIVIDDCSQDDTAKAVAGFTDPRVVYIQHSSNRGEAACRNTGVGAARGEYIAFLDDDDEWFPHKLALQVELLEKSGPEVGGVYCGYIKVDSGRVVHRRVPEREGDLSRDILRRNWPGSPSCILLRAGCFSGERFDTGLPCMTDYDMWIRLAGKFEFASIRRPLLRYSVHPGQISADPEAMATALSLMIEKHRIRPFSLRKSFVYREFLHIGVRSMMRGETDAGRAAFGSALRFYPIGVKGLLGWCLSLTGRRSFAAVWSLRLKMQGIHSGHSQEAAQ